jgi:hypothetical protein
MSALLQPYAPDEDPDEDDEDPDRDEDEDDEEDDDEEEEEETWWVDGAGGSSPAIKIDLCLTSGQDLPTLSPISTSS